MNIVQATICTLSLGAGLSGVYALHKATEHKLNEQEPEIKQFHEMTGDPCRARMDIYGEDYDCQLHLP